MATKIEKIAEIESNVQEIIAVTEPSKLDRPGGLRTYDVICLVTVDNDGNTEKVVQRLYTKNEGESTEVAYLGNEVRKNFDTTTAGDNPTVLKEKFFLKQLQALEAQVGGEVKVDIQQLDNLGIQYFVFVAPGETVKKITTTLDGTTLIREIA